MKSTLRRLNDERIIAKEQAERHEEMGREALRQGNREAWEVHARAAYDAWTRNMEAIEQIDQLTTTVS